MWKKQKLDSNRIYELKASHIRRLEIFDEMEAATSPSDLLHLSRLFDALEFHQQALWGFKLDPNFHLWWSVPQCTCEEIHNRRFTGTPFRSVDKACPVHGQLTTTIKSEMNVSGRTTYDMRKAKSSPLLHFRLPGSLI